MFKEFVTEQLLSCLAFTISGIRCILRILEIIRMVCTVLLILSATVFVCIQELILQLCFQVTKILHRNYHPKKWDCSRGVVKIFRHRATGFSIFSDLQASIDPGKVHADVVSRIYIDLRLICRGPFIPPMQNGQNASRFTKNDVVTNDTWKNQIRRVSRLPEC